MSKAKATHSSNNMIGMKLTAKNVYINGDYGRVEKVRIEENGWAKFDDKLRSVLVKRVASSPMG